MAMTVNQMRACSSFALPKVEKDMLRASCSAADTI